MEPRIYHSNKDGRTIYIYDFIINDEVYQLLTQNDRATVQFIQFVSEEIDKLLNSERNPLLLHYKPLEVNEILYYKIERNSIKRITKKPYKD